MTSYVNAVNQRIAQEAARVPNLVLFGENIDKGSCISGLTRKLPADLFSANFVSPADWDRVKQSAARTRTLMVIDDSKSVDLPCHRLMQEVAAECPQCDSLAITRESHLDYGVCPDTLEIDYEWVVSWVAGASQGKRRFNNRLEAVI